MKSTQSRECLIHSSGASVSSGAVSSRRADETKSGLGASSDILSRSEGFVVGRGCMEDCAVAGAAAGVLCALAGNTTNTAESSRPSMPAPYNLERGTWDISRDKDFLQ